eukprot:8297470-Prorocentrum_lima.AAC.1
MLFIITSHYSVRQTLGQGYLFKDLGEIKMQPCSGDQNLEPWFNRWLDIYHSMDTEPSGDLKRSILE